jgi:hypothetical protein
MMIARLFMAAIWRFRSDLFCYQSEYRRASLELDPLSTWRIKAGKLRCGAKHLHDEQARRTRSENRFCGAVRQSIEFGHDKSIIPLQRRQVPS